MSAATVLLHWMFLPYEAAVSSLSETCPLVPGFSDCVLPNPHLHTAYLQTVPAPYTNPTPFLQSGPLASCSLSFTLDCIYGFDFMDSCNILSSMNRSILSSIKAGNVCRHCLAWHETWWIPKKYLLNGYTNFCSLYTTKSRK